MSVQDPPPPHVERPVRVTVRPPRALGSRPRGTERRGGSAPPVRDDLSPRDARPAPLVMRVRVPAGEAPSVEMGRRLPLSPWDYASLPMVRKALIADAGSAASQTMPISRMLATVAIAFAVGLLFGARGIVHGGEGMSDGLERSLVLGVGHGLVAVTDATRFTTLWDSAESALGRSQQPSTAPLLTQGITPISGTPIATSAGFGQPTPGPLRPAAVHPVVQVKPRVPAAAHPLRLLVTGDSLTEFMGPQLIDEAVRAGKIRGFNDTHYGTGLVRPDFVDWSVVARQQVAQYRPDAVVVMIGGNDFQNMTMPSGQIIDSRTPAWIREYQRRAAIVMRVWARNGAARVYWLSMPPARDAAWTENDADINIALQRAARSVPGAHFVNVLGPVTDHGRYADFVTVNGQPVLVRTTDGIHFTEAGSRLIADEMLARIRHDWKLGKHR